MENLVFILYVFENAIAIGRRKWKPTSAKAIMGEVCPFNANINPGSNLDMKMKSDSIKLIQ